MSSLFLYLTLYLMHQWRVRADANLAEYRGGSTSAVTPSNLDGAARAETDQDQILNGPRAKRFLAWYRLSEPFGSLPASNFTAARFLSVSGDWSWPRKSVASKTMPGTCSAARFCAIEPRPSANRETPSRWAAAGRVVDRPRNRRSRQAG